MSRCEAHFSHNQAGVIMPKYHHGVRVIEISDGTRPIKTIETSIIGAVCTANDADPEAFPLNTPVLLFGLRDILDKCGTTGTLAYTLDAIKDQGEAVCMIVRVEEDEDEAQTISNVIGSYENGRYTGLQALLACKNKFGGKPRILGVPKYDKSIHVAKELAIIAEKLRGFAYVGAEGEKPEDLVDYRKNFASKRMMLIWPEFQGWSTITNSEIDLWASARALGLRAKIDDEIGWHKTLSNVNVNGVSGLTRDAYWDIQDSNTEAIYLNKNHVTTLIRDKGFKFWGSRTCTDDPLFNFESAVRTGDILADTIAEAHHWAIDKPQSVTLIRDIRDSVNSKMREWTNFGYLFGGECWFDDRFNNKESIKDGKLVLDYDYTPIPPLEDLTFQARITDRYIVDFIAQLVRTNP